MLIFDFIKSWFFYPKMKSYFENYWGIEFHMSRIQYSWWHSHVGKLK